MKFKQSIFMIILLLFLTLDALCQNNWELNKNKDGIQVYTRSENNSDFKSFKAITTLNFSTEKILKTLRNAEEYTKWYGFTKNSYVLSLKKNVQYNYVETIFPWPYSNRDMVYQMTIHQLDSGDIKVILTGNPDIIPEKKGIVRMKKAEGYILLHPKENKTEIIYIFHSEPGDNIPSILANSSISELPFKTLSGLRNILESQL